MNNNARARFITRRIKQGLISFDKIKEYKIVAFVESVINEYVVLNE